MTTLPSHLTVISKRDLKRQSKLIRIGEELADQVLGTSGVDPHLAETALRFKVAKPTLASVIKELNEGAAQIDRMIPPVDDYS